MTTHICESCYTPIPTGEAVLRATGDFVSVRAWHRGCYDAMHPVAPEHTHTQGCRAVNFDESGKYTGTRASDPERCGTCRAEAEEQMRSLTGATS